MEAFTDVGFILNTFLFLFSGILVMWMAAGFAMLESVVKAIAEASKTGKIGDGKIFVYDLENVIRIRTGEEGEDAI